MEDRVRIELTVGGFADRTVTVSFPSSDLVRQEGLEPPRPKASASKADVSAIPSTGANLAGKAGVEPAMFAPKGSGLADRRRRR